ncbi:unnamed protein product [Gongylonema pulchrum]|uniref:Uncharacterized protein n=1 Tax=Gongylonema pulchrum TaxID=637853 RepID=A0A183EJH2_9BILA|nr:unnamed protein product [Gongylonema pulchrum]
MSKTVSYGSPRHAADVGLRQSATQQSRWFSGLRARISQINMPEWLSQLGIGSSSSAQKMPNDDAGVYGEVANERGLDCIPEETQPTSHPAVQTDGMDTLNSWLWGEVDCEDTLALQHFGPLKNLVTGCNHPGKGHDFLSLVTLDCRTADSTLSSCHEMSTTSVSPSLKVFAESDDVPEKGPIDETCGFVKIHMNFMRPINVVAGESLSFLDVTSESSKHFLSRKNSSVFLDICNLLPSIYP